MHSHGRALNGLLPRAVDDVEAYDVREGELISGVVNGWNFGDGHFHDQQLLEAVQERCGFEPGEVRVITLESQPAHIQRQRYRIYDAADRPDRGGLGRRRRHGRAAALARRAPGTSRSRSPARAEQPAAAAGCERRRSSSARARTGSPCAVALARDGRRGDRARGRRRRSAAARAPSELTVPGVLHDDCSAVHPMAVGLAVPELARPRAPRARVALAGGRPRPSARRRQRRRDAALDRRDRRRPRRGRRGLAAAVRAPAACVRRRSTRTSSARSCTSPRTRSGSPRFGLPAATARRRCSHAAGRREQARALFGGVAAHAFARSTGR